MPCFKLLFFFLLTIQSHNAKKHFCSINTAYTRTHTEVKINKYTKTRGEREKESKMTV